MDTNAQFLRYTWLSAQLVQMVTRGSWLWDWCAGEALTMHRKCFTVNTLSNFKRHRLLHRGLWQQNWYLFWYSSFKQLNSQKKIQYYITVLWECQTSTVSGKFCRVCGGRVQNKANNRGGTSASTQHTPESTTGCLWHCCCLRWPIHSQHFCNSCYATTRCEGCSAVRCQRTSLRSMSGRTYIGKGAL